MEDLSRWMPIIISALALIVTALSYRRTSHNDTSDTAAERATMSADIRYIRTAIEDIKVQSRTLQADIRDIDRRLTAVESSVKSAHHRIDETTRTETDV